VSRFHLLAPSSALAINQTVNQNFPGARSATFLNANPRWVHHKAEVRAAGRISPPAGEIISPYGREFLRPIRLEPFLLPRHPWRLVAIHFLFHTFLYILIIKLFCDHDAKVETKSMHFLSLPPFTEHSRKHRKKKDFHPSDESL
jgi:hypothetical protein